MMNNSDIIFDCIVIGGGQSALATAYYLRRAKLNYILIDKNPTSGGSWRNVWDSLHLFSASKHNALPGYPMPPTKSEYPSKDEIIHYLRQYEKRYEFPVRRGVEVQEVKTIDDVFHIVTTEGVFKSKSVVSATGTQGNPNIPNDIGADTFSGDQYHSSEYRIPDDFLGKRTLVVGAGNSGAQIFAELHQHTVCFWGVNEKPEFLPEDVDGKTLFDQASEIYRAQLKGESIDRGVFNLGNIVLVPEVLEAYKAGVMDEYHIIDYISRNEVVWKDGTSDLIDAIVWCTGFNYSTEHLRSLAQTDERGKLLTEGTRSKEIPGLWLVGYGNWTGMASATIIGVGRTAKRTVNEITKYLDLL